MHYITSTKTTCYLVGEVGINDVGFFNMCTTQQGRHIACAAVVAMYTFSRVTTCTAPTNNTDVVVILLLNDAFTKDLK